MTTTVLGFLFQLLTASAAYGGDFPRHFAPVTDMTRKLCNEPLECVVTQTNNQKYQIVFKTTGGDKETTITAVSITPLKGKAQEYQLPIPKAVIQGDMTPLFVADINGDGFNDMALQAGIGSRTGYVYFYWIYNPKTKSFAFTKTLIPAIQVVKGKMVSLTTFDEYRVSAQYEIIESKTKRTAPL